jgi:hypothetical protein
VGSILGGLLALVAYFVGALVTLDGWTRALLVSLPIVWLVVREVLRRRFYQRYGRVVEVTLARDRRWHLVLTGFTALVSAGVLVWALWHLASGGVAQGTGGWASALYLAFVAVLPVLVWRYLWTPMEFIVGVFLIAQAAVVAAGGHYALGQQLQAPAAAVVLIALGAKQHREFRELERRIGRSRGR